MTLYDIGSELDLGCVKSLLGRPAAYAPVLTNAPTPIEPRYLDELGLRLLPRKA